MRVTNEQAKKDMRYPSGYKGVDWFSPRNKWRAQIKQNGKKIHIGLYKSKADAAIAYNNKAIELHGEFALLNVIEKEATE